MASIFTQIIRGELPSVKVLETEHELAFLDIRPFSEGHTLVVPKREVASFDELDPEELRSLITTVQIVAKGVSKAMETPHYNVSLNNGAPAGQIIFHVHFHVIPRYEGQDRSRVRNVYSDGQMESVGEKIRKAIESLNRG